MAEFSSVVQLDFKNQMATMYCTIISMKMNLNRMPDMIDSAYMPDAKEEFDVF